MCGGNVLTGNSTPGANDENNMDGEESGDDQENDRADPSEGVAGVLL